MKSFQCADGCKKMMPRKGDRCPECVAAFKKKVDAAVKKNKVAGYILQVSYHIGRYSFATLYMQVPASSFKEAVERASRARRELDYFQQLGIPGVDIKLGSIFYKKELKKEVLP